MHALLGALVSVLLVAALASAADEKKAQSPQAQRMTECSAQAGEKKLAGDARKQFMAECLKSHATTHEEGAKTEKASEHHKAPDGQHNTQAEKMKACNQEAGAKNLHGDDRKQFMSECLKAEKKS